MVRTRKSLLKGKSEAKAFRQHGLKSVLPHEFAATMATATGSNIVTAVAMLQAMATSWLTELNKKGFIMLPGIGTFTVKHTAAVPGRMREVCGVWRACKPKLAASQIVFTAFSDVEALLANGHSQAASAAAAATGTPPPRPVADQPQPEDEPDPPEIGDLDDPNDDSFMGEDSPVSEVPADSLVYVEAAPKTPSYHVDMATAGLPADGHVPTSSSGVSG